MNNSDNIRINLDCRYDENIDLQRLEKLIATTCREFQEFDALIQVNIVNDAAMKEIHQQFLNKAVITDVISFDLSDEFEPQPNYQIVVNLDQARRQADRRKHSTEAELALYITHGLLHQLGYDDCTESQARAMHEKEDAILQASGFGVIYHNNEINNK